MPRPISTPPLSTPPLSTPPLWVVVVAGAAFWTLSAFSHVAVDPVSGWLERVHAPVYVDIVLDLVMVALVAALCAGVVLWRFGAGRTLQRTLASVFTAVFALWLVLSFLLIGARYQWAPVVWGFAPYSAAELIFGSLFVCGAVLLAARAADLPIVRRASAAGAPLT
jgi:hypothetical protein